MSDETPLTPAPVKPGFNWDRIASILAIGLSVTAILVAFAEVSTIRAQSRAAVWPYLQVSQSYSDEGYEISVMNKGVGPALIRDVTLSQDGELVSRLDAAILDLMGEERAFSNDVYRHSGLSDSVVAAGETVTYFGVPWTEDTRAFVDRWGNKVDLTLCYCSIHDDCWQTSLVSGVSRSIKTCEKRVAGPGGPTVSTSDFDMLAGDDWTGELVYRDYGSDEMVSIPANASLKQPTKTTIVYRLEYPKEPDYNTTQRIRISRDGRRIDDNPLIERKREDGALVLVTEHRGTDDGKPADIRVTYRIKRNAFSITMDVKTDDVEDFVIRNSYRLTR